MATLSKTAFLGVVLAVLGAAGRTSAMPTPPVFRMTAAAALPGSDDAQAATEEAVRYVMLGVSGQPAAQAAAALAAAGFQARDLAHWGVFAQFAPQPEAMRGPLAVVPGDGCAAYTLPVQGAVAIAAAPAYGGDGNCSALQRAQRAADAGAVALLVAPDAAGAFIFLPQLTAAGGHGVSNDRAVLPYVAVSGSSGAVLRQLQAAALSGGAQLWLTLEAPESAANQDDQPAFGLQVTVVVGSCALSVLLLACAVVLVRRRRAGAAWARQAAALAESDAGVDGQDATAAARAAVCSTAIDVLLARLPLTVYSDADDDATTALQPTVGSAPMQADSDAKQSERGKCSGASRATACVVCLEDFQAGSTVITLPCRHVFHCDCVGAWLRLRFTCPLCKFNLLLHRHVTEDGAGDTREEEDASVVAALAILRQSDVSSAEGVGEGSSTPKSAARDDWRLVLDDATTDASDSDAGGELSFDIVPAQGVE